MYLLTLPSKPMHFKKIYYYYYYYIIIIIIITIIERNAVGRSGASVSHQLLQDLRKAHPAHTQQAIASRACLEAAPLGWSLIVMVALEDLSTELSGSQWESQHEGTRTAGRWLGQGWQGFECAQSQPEPCRPFPRSTHQLWAASSESPGASPAFLPPRSSSSCSSRCGAPGPAFGDRGGHRGTLVPQKAHSCTTESRWSQGWRGASAAENQVPPGAPGGASLCPHRALSTVRPESGPLQVQPGLEVGARGAPGALWRAVRCPDANQAGTSARPANGY